MIPGPHDLTYFVEVSTSQNLSRAAERLGISQPSLTLAIQRLEQSIGAALLIRSKKGVTLTQSGKQLLVHTQDLLQKWEKIKGNALASTHQVQGCYTIGCHPSVALYSLGGLIPNLLEKYPQLEIKLHHDLSRKITESVIRMEIDLGIAVNPIRHPDLIIRKLCDDEVTFWVGEGNRKVQDYRSKEAVLICDPSLNQSKELIKKLKNTEIQFDRILPTSNLELITLLVAKGAGIGIIPSRVVASSQATLIQTPLRTIPKAPKFRDELCLLYRAENKSVRSIQAICEGIQTVFAKTC